jgi:hypothetical protein
MIQFTHSLLYPSWTKPVVNGAAEEHQKHSHYKKDDAHCHLPALPYSRPDNPHRSEGKNGADEVCPSISFFSFTHFIQIEN